MAEIVERIVSRYYAALEEGKVLGRKCLACGNIEWPPVYACNACGHLDTEWVEMSQEGEITILLVPTVMSSRPAYSDLEPYCYGTVQTAEGPARNVMILNASKSNADYINAHLPYPAHMQIVQRDGYKTAVFAIDPIKADGTPDTELISKRIADFRKAEKQADDTEQINTSESPKNTETEVNPEIFATLAEIVAKAYNVDVSEITPDTPFEGKFEASSIVFVGIVAMIENEFDVFFNITEAAKNKTVGALAKAIELQMEQLEEK